MKSLLLLLFLICVLAVIACNNKNNPNNPIIPDVNNIILEQPSLAKQPSGKWPSGERPPIIDRIKILPQVCFGHKIRVITYAHDPDFSNDTLFYDYTLHYRCTHDVKTSGNIITFICTKIMNSVPFGISVRDRDGDSVEEWKFFNVINCDNKNKKEG